MLLKEESLLKKESLFLPNTFIWFILNLAHSMTRYPMLHDLSILFHQLPLKNNMSLMVWFVLLIKRHWVNYLVHLLLWLLKIHPMLLLQILLRLMLFNLRKESLSNLEVRRKVKERRRKIILCRKKKVVSWWQMKASLSLPYLYWGKFYYGLSTLCRI